MNDVFRRMLPVSGRRSGWHLVSVQLVLALLVTLVTGAAVVSYDKMVRDNAERQMQDTADLAEVFLNQQNTGVASVISSVMKAADVNAAMRTPDSPRSKQVIARTMQVLDASGTNISSVIVLDPNGHVLSTLPQRLPPGYDLSGRIWVRQARITSSYSVAPVFESLLTNGLYLTTIAVPVRLNADPQGRLLGIVAIAWKLDGYQQFVNAYQRNRGIRLTVIDGTGAVVADGDPAASPASATLARRVAAGHRLLAGANHRIMAVSAGNSAGPEASSTGENWRVISQEPERTAMRPALFFRAVAIAAGILIMLATFLIAWFRSRAGRARREALRHLEQSQTRIRDLADSSPNLLFRMTADGVVLFASRASENLLGMSADELVGLDLIAMLELESSPDIPARVATLIEDGQPQLFVARTIGANGAPRIVECSLRLGQIEDVTEIWGALRDITDRRSARDQMEQLFQLSEDFMAVVDFDGLLVQTNPVWSAAFDLSTEQLAGTPFEQNFEPEDHERVAADLTRLAADRGVANFETRYLRDGVTRTLLWTAGADPRRRMIYTVGRDITNHKELQRALAETRDQALEASRLKSEFVATMSHEIRTPMNGVIGLTDLLLGTRLDATQRRYIEGVRTAGDALLSVINDILDFSKIEAGRLQLDNVDFRLEDVVDDVVTLVRQASSAKGLELTVDYESGVPFALNGDPGRVRQILLNLAHNAVKFTEQGGVSIRIEPGPARADGEVPVVFKVIDTGIGLDPSRLEELFEPFRQADEGVTRAYGGTGLGLSICRRLADLMGGSISASSELGHGAVFAAELVFAPAADWGRSVRGRDARGLAVLVVDDNEVNRLVMITQLNRWGMRPVAAASAEEAMEVLTRRSAPAGGYDLAVIDMHMPETDGLELVKQLRAMPALMKLPVILLTSDETVDPRTALEHGISARLTKPVQQSALFDALTRVGLPNSAAEPEPAPVTRYLPGPSVITTAPPAGGPARVDAFTGRPIVVPEQPAAGEPGSTGPTGPVPHDTGYQLLLVEDNDINQTVALGILSQLGYQVDVAGDGIQAVTMAGQHAYDAILMDCQMPRLDGYAATVELRKKPGTRTTPIIAMTAATFAADRQRCFDSGMDDFIAKPVRAATLQATLNRWLRSSGAAEPAGEELAGPTREPVPDEHVSTRQLVAAVRDQIVAPEKTRLAPMVPAQSRKDGAVIADTRERVTELLGEGSQIEVDLVREIITSFLSRTVDLLQRLTLAVAADDAESARLHAHSLVGAGLNLGTVQVVRISQQIEADAKAGRAASSVARLVELEVALDEARVLLRDLAANLPDPVPAAGAS